MTIELYLNHVLTFLIMSDIILYYKGVNQIGSAHCMVAHDRFYCHIILHFDIYIQQILIHGIAALVLLLGLANCCCPYNTLYIIMTRPLYG